MVSKKNQKRRGITEAPPAIVNRDHLERANYTFQASIFLQQLALPLSSSSKLQTVIDRKGKRRAIEPDIQPWASREQTAHTHSEEHIVDPNCEAAPSGSSHPAAATAALRQADFPRLARAEMKSFRRWTVHNQVKCDPSLKRAICKACSTVLVPGLTSRVRVRPSKTHAHVVHHTCLTCSTPLTIPAPPTGPPPEPGVDGTVRARRRAKAAKRSKVPFHLREYDIAAASDGNKSVHSDGAGDRSSGHVLWRGNKLVTGWGVISPCPLHETPDEPAAPPHEPSTPNEV